jgi:hypothetical protein
MLTTDDVEKLYVASAFGGAKCGVCSKLAMTRATSWVQLVDAFKVDPMLRVKYMKGELQPLMHKARDGKWLVKWAVAYACQSHSSEMERAAAKHPDWVYVSFDRAPNPKNRVVVGASRF